MSLGSFKTPWQCMKKSAARAQWNPRFQVPDTQMPQRCNKIEKEALERIGRCRQGEGIEPPPPLITLERIQCANIAFQPGGIQRISARAAASFRPRSAPVVMGECRALSPASAKRGHKIARQMEGQGIGPARPRRAGLSQMRTEALCQFCVEAFFIQRQQRGRF